MDPTLARQYELYEERHWWSAARRDILHAMLDRFVPAAKQPNSRWLDIGCATGAILRSYPGFAEKIGLESDPQTVARANEKGITAHLIQDPWNLSPFGSFDCITLFDVLEHVEHEQLAIAAVHSALKPNGIALITVPALMTLWSDHDVVAHHYRRYSRASLLKLFPTTQWQALKITYFSTLLFPLIFGVRKLKNLAHRFSKKPPQHDIRIGPPIIDNSLESIFRLEKHLLPHTNLPIGSSLLLVARKTP
jgi:2-polyprenyl-3-methyl-5-hydroxy-6-metoxy-1,4-benzoquinol methylase